MIIEENVSLKQHNSFGIIANAAYLSAATSQRELINALDFADSKRIPVCILGEGPMCYLLAITPDWLCEWP